MEDKKSIGMESHRSSNSSLDSCESFSKGSISMEFDDYPLDLISPVRKDDLEEYPCSWRPVTPPPACDSPEIPNAEEDAEALAQSLAIPEEEIPLNSEGFSEKEEPKKETDTFIDSSKANGTFFFNKNTTLPKVNTQPTGKCTFQESVLYDMAIGIQNHSTPKHCLTCRTCCLSCSRPCWAKYNPLSTNPTWGQRLKYSLMCPPHGRIGQALSLAVVISLVWTILYALTGSEALPGGHFFALVMMVFFGYLGGLAVSLIRLPPLIGMLLVGCLMCNVSGIDLAKDIDDRWSGALRSGALVVILIRAGIGLDPSTLNRLSAVVIRLAVIPCIAEALIVAVASHYLLGFPWTWGFLLGFGLSAVTPVVVVPGVMWLADRGYDTQSGLPALLSTAASLEDLVTLSCFSALLGSLFSSSDDLAWNIVRGPLQAVAGVFLGAGFGILCWFIPNKHHKQRTLLRCLLLLGGGLSFVYLSRAMYCPGTGALGCLIMAVVAAYRWRRENIKDGRGPIDRAFTQLWSVVEPLLFTLVGAEINLKKLDPPSVGLGLAIIFIASLVRMGAALVAVTGSSLSLRQKVFIPLAWLPRDGAVVQAAITSMVLDTARREGVNEAVIHLALKVMLVTVLMILVKAPVSAVSTEVLLPALLKNKPLPYSNSDPDAWDKTQDLLWDNHLDFDTELTKMALTSVIFNAHNELVVDRETSI